jgi:hypothetical protein
MSVKVHPSSAETAANKSFVATVKIVALVIAWYGVNIGEYLLVLHSAQTEQSF